MDTVVLKSLFHRNRECIGLFFDKNQALNVLIRRITGMKWSQTNKCWYIPLTRESYIQLKTLLQEHVIQVIEELKPYLEAKKKRNPVNPDLLVNKTVFQPSIITIQQNRLKIQATISPVN
jgi:hypothetical protein